MSKGTMIEAIKATLDELDEPTLQSIMSIAYGLSAGAAQPAETKAEPGKKPKFTRIRTGGSSRWAKMAFESLWKEGVLTASGDVLLARVRQCGKYFPNIEEMEAALLKSPTVYQKHSDGNWSRVNPPKLKVVKTA